MKSYNIDRRGDWERHLPFFLMKAGAMQGWVNQDMVINEDWVNRTLAGVRIAPFTKDLIEEESKPFKNLAPALCFKWETDGTSTPSQDNAPQIRHDDIMNYWNFRTRNQENFHKNFFYAFCKNEFSKIK